MLTVKKKQVLTNKTEYADYSDAGAYIREMKSGDSVKYMNRQSQAERF